MAKFFLAHKRRAADRLLPVWIPFEELGGWNVDELGRAERAIQFNGLRRLFGKGAVDPFESAESTVESKLVKLPLIWRVDAGLRVQPDPRTLW